MATKEVEERRRPNALKMGVAQDRAAKNGLGYDVVLGDVVLLLEQIGKIEHEQDRDLIAQLRARYGQRLA
jgi:hypothetical protein